MKYRPHRPKRMDQLRHTNKIDGENPITNTYLTVKNRPKSSQNVTLEKDVESTPSIKRFWGYENQFRLRTNVENESVKCEFYKKPSIISTIYTKWFWITMGFHINPIFTLMITPIIQIYLPFKFIKFLLPIFTARWHGMFGQIWSVLVKLWFISTIFQLSASALNCSVSKQIKNILVT